MKKLTLLIVLFLISSGTSFSQLGTKTEQFQITAMVLSALTITEVTPLQFGSVFPGENKHIDVAGTKTYSVTGETTSPASFTIDGAPNRQVSVAFTGHTSISNGGNTMNVVYIPNDASAQTGSGYSLTSGWDPTSASTTVSLDGTGDAAVYLGGEVQPALTQVIGAYAGTATITVSYTGI